MSIPTPDPVEVWVYPNFWFMLVSGIVAFIILVERFFPGAWGKLWKRGK